MKKHDERWQGLSREARAQLVMRDYRPCSLAAQIAEAGVDAGQIATMDREAADLAEAWIPGVEVFARTIHPQRHRGSFGELVRCEEGPLARIGLWPRQWAAARMFAQTAKGFHVHPPSIPAGTSPKEWFQRLFVAEPANFALRRYEEEQWDVMFFVQGRVEIILREVRAGMPARTMRCFVEGENHRGPNNVAIVIPAGVAHALRVEGSEDLIMVYGTSISFDPAAEGRIASEVETSQLPAEWQKFLT
ncbi:MAG TPA: hypothetical protein VGF73_07200 [Chthoniobacterales bacterium]